VSRLGIFAKTFPGTTAETVLSAARDAGYGCVQFNLACCGLPPMPDALPPGLAGDIAAASARTGVAIAALSGTYNMIHPDPAVREAGLGRLGLLLSQARAMGATLVTLCTGTRDPQDQWRHHPDNDTPEAWADLLTEMAKAAALAEQCEVDLGIEPEHANVVSSAARAARLLAEVPSSRLRIVLDPANLIDDVARGLDPRAYPSRRPDDGVAPGRVDARVAPAHDGKDGAQDSLYAEACDRLGDRIAMAHAKDRDAQGAVVPAGTGIIDFDAFFAALDRIGFAGPVVTHGLAAADAPSVARFLKSKIRP
jgi:sugar phosphate isomerase/epimerase